MTRGRASRPTTLLSRLLPLVLLAGAAAPLRAASPESEEYRPGDAQAGDGSRTRSDAAPSASPSPEAPTQGVPARATPADTAPATPAAASGSGGADSASVGSGSGATPARSAPPRDIPRPPPAAAGPRPRLAVLPTVAAAAAAPGARPGQADLETVEEALRMSADQAGRHQVLAPEDAHGRAAGAAEPRGCFGEACAARAGRRLGVDVMLLSAYAPPVPGTGRGGYARLSLVLYEVRSGKVSRAVEARACPGAPGLIPFIQQAAWRLLLPGAATASGRDDGPGAGDTADAAAPGRPGGCRLVAELAVDSGSWRGIAWLRPPAPADNRLRWAAVGGGVAAAGLALAWAQGQLLGEDPNAAAPGTPLRDGGGAESWLRGFFAAPNPGARIAALGGAGLALVGGADAVVMNPAALADAAREAASADRRSLPGGAPSFRLAYAGPLKGGLFQGLAIQHEGDALANETSLHAGFAWDWGTLSPGLEGFRTGAALKGYLAKVGSGGTGADRSTGHSAGLGLDLGVKARLSPRVSAAAAVRDALGFLRHANTFTDREYWELLPPEYRLGAAYRVDSTCVLVLDGQKGMVADQIDHVRLGAEKRVFRFLAARAGLHQAFGRHAVRKLSAGFGIDSEGLGDRPARGRVSLGYAYDFGLGEDAPLGTGQSFSLEVSW